MTQHWGNLNTLSTETRGSIALSNTLDQLGPGFRLPHGAITDTVGGSHVRAEGLEPAACKASSHTFV